MCVCVCSAEWANHSIQELSSTLEQLSHEGEDVGRRDGRHEMMMMAEEDGMAARSQKTQSEAGDNVSCLDWRT